MKKVPVILVIVSGCLLNALQSKGNTIATGVLSASALCTGSNVKVPFTVSGTYNAGNLFTAQLSDANGSFASAINIGTLTGITDDTIAATIPAGTLAGTGYRIRVVSANPAVTGSDNGTNITISSGASAWSYVGNKAFSGVQGDFGRGSLERGRSEILFASDGTPYVAYTDDEVSYNYVANVRKFDGTNWVPVGTRGFGMIVNFQQSAHYTQLAKAPDGTLYAAYRDAVVSSGFGVVTVVKFNGTDWVLVGQRGFSASLSGSIHSNVYGIPSLAVDGNGTPYVAYTETENANKMTVAKFDGANWVTVGGPGFSVAIGDYSQIVFDAGGAPYIAWNEPNNSYRVTVKKFNGTGWVTVGSAGISAGQADYPNLVQDDNGTLYLSYIDYGFGQKPCVMKFNGTNWIPIGVQGFFAGKAYSSCSLVIDHNGTPYVGFQDGAVTPLKGTVMKFDGASWVTVGPTGFTPSTAWPVIVGIGNNNTPYAFFADGSYNWYASVMKFSAAGAVTENTISTNQSLCSGTTPATLTGTAPTGGTGSYTYLWQSSTDNINFTAATGTNNGQNYSPPLLSQQTWFNRVVVSGCSTENSAAVKISINPAINNNTITADQSICAGSVPATLNGSVPSGGDGVSYSYQWQISTDNISFSNISGANSSNCSPQSINQTTWYKRTVSSGGCANTSTAVAITVAGSVSNNTISSDQAICTGTSPSALTGSAPSGGTGTYAYQWQSSTDNTSYTNAAGTNTGQNYTPGSITQTTWFRRTVTSGSSSCATVISTAVKITINPAINNNTISADQSVCAGSVPAAFNGSVPSGGDGVSYTYQWQSSTDNNTFNTITGAAGSNYSPPSINQATWFKRTASSGGCSHTSTVIAITIVVSVTNNTIGSGHAICTGTTPSALTGSAPSGGNGTYTYQWQSSADNTSFSDITGATNSNYSPSAITQTTWFRRTVTSGNGNCATVISTAVKIAINPVVNNNTITADQTICGGSIPATLKGSVPSGGDGVSYTYQWQNSSDNNTFTNISGAASSNYSPLSINQTTWFRRTVNSGGCSHVSLSIAVTIADSVTNNTIGSDQAICSGTTPSTLIGSAPAGGNGTFTYQWQNSSDNASFIDIAGATNNNYGPSSITQITWFRRIVTSGNNGCASNISGAVMISVNYCNSILIPNVFSPNGDGINDTWIINFLANYPNCKVEVFNRGGSQIFVSTGYPKPWDGNYKDKPVPIGMYYYVIDLRDGTMPVTGSVLIIK